MSHKLWIIKGRQANLSLKTMSERDGCDIKRLKNLIGDGVIKIQSRSMSDPLHSDLVFKVKWFGSELPLMVRLYYFLGIWFGDNWHQYHCYVGGCIKIWSIETISLSTRQNQFGQIPSNIFKMLPFIWPNLGRRKRLKIIHFSGKVIRAPKHIKSLFRKLADSKSFLDAYDFIWQMIWAQILTL